MKSAEAATAGKTATVVPLRPAARQRRHELEFLPAALEIIETPASPVGRAIAGTIILFFVGAIVWASLGQVDIIATASGRVIPNGKTKLIQPFETGVVRQVLVEDGQTVQAGDVLVELDATTNAADEARLTHDLIQDRLDLARLNALLANDQAGFVVPDGADAAQLETTRRQMQEQAAEQAAKLAGLDKQIAQKQAEGRESSATIAKIDAMLPMLRGQRDIREQLLDNEFGSKYLYLQSQQSVVEQEHQLVVETHHRAGVEGALGALERQRAQTEAEYRKGLFGDLSKAETSANEHRQELAKAAEKRALQMMTAPVDGTVQQLMVHTVGGVVTPAQQLMVIVPKSTQLEVEATMLNKDVGFVRAGQEVEVKVETFTFTRYGLLHGTVESVSRDVVAPDQNSADARNGKTTDAEIPKDEQERQSRQPAYIALISVAETGIETEDGWRALEPGMAVTAEIKTGQRRVIEYLMSPLLRYKQDAMKER